MTNPRQVEKQPILDRYIPAHPVDRYTFKKWNTDDWFRHNENKYFQSEQDRGQVGGHQTRGNNIRRRHLIFIFSIRGNFCCLHLSKWDLRFVLRRC